MFGFFELSHKKTLPDLPVGSKKKNLPDLNEDTAPRNTTYFSMSFVPSKKVYNVGEEICGKRILEHKEVKTRGSVSQTFGIRTFLATFFFTVTSQLGGKVRIFGFVPSESSWGWRSHRLPSRHEVRLKIKGRPVTKDYYAIGSRCVVEFKGFSGIFQGRDFTAEFLCYFFVFILILARTL